MSTATLSSKRASALSQTPSDPFAALLPFGRLFEDFWNHASPWGWNGNGVLAPSLDIAEDKDAFTVTAELPGIKKEDVKITFENGVLGISGEKLQESETKDKTMRRIERRYGAFSRTIALPVAVNFDASSAQMRDGVLEVRIPKREEVKPKTLAVK
jgi:HSP20 family protein